VIVFILLTILIFYLIDSLFYLQISLYCNKKAGDATEKDSKILILEISRNIIYLLIH